MRRSRTWLLAMAMATVMLGLGTTARAQAPAAESGAEKKVTLNLKDVPLRNAVELLFAGSGLQYSIDPNVQNVPVSLSIRDIGLQAALRLVIRQAAVLQPGLTVTREGDIFVVRVRPPMPPATANPAEEPPPDQDATGDITWEKIPVQFNSVLAFVAAFGGDRIPTELDVLSMSGGGMMGGMGGGYGGGMMGGGMMGGMGGMGGFGGGGMGGFGGGGMGGFGGGGMGGFGGGGLGGFGGGGLGGFGGGGLGGFGGGGFGGGGFGGGLGGGLGGFGGRF